MRHSIWRCLDDRVHIAWNGVELEFDDMDDFINSLETWQEWALLHDLGNDFTPDQAWGRYAELVRN